jgi:hypothetical protein
MTAAGVAVVAATVVAVPSVHHKTPVARSHPASHAPAAATSLAPSSPAQTDGVSPQARATPVHHGAGAQVVHAPKPTHAKHAARGHVARVSHVTPVGKAAVLHVVPPPGIEKHGSNGTVAPGSSGEAHAGPKATPPGQTKGETTADSGDTKTPPGQTKKGATEQTSKPEAAAAAPKHAPKEPAEKKTKDDAAVPTDASATDAAPQDPSTGQAVTAAAASDVPGQNGDQGQGADHSNGQGADHSNGHGHQ